MAQSTQQPTLYLMLGYPGAGKTTAAQIIAKLTGAVHLSSDDFHTAVFDPPRFDKEEHVIRYRALDFVTNLLLKNRISAVYDANLNRRRHRQEKYAISAQNSAKTVLVWVQTPLEIAHQRATKDSNSDPKRPYGNLDEATFQRIARAIEIPHKDEPCMVLDGTKLSEPYVKAKLGL